MISDFTIFLMSPKSTTIPFFEWPKSLIGIPFTLTNSFERENFGDSYHFAKISEFLHEYYFGIKITEWSLKQKNPLPKKWEGISNNIKTME